MAASFESTLTRLEEQVNAGTCRIAAACTRLENLIPSLCKDDISRPFISLLGRLCNILLGDECNAGWIETATDTESIDSLYFLLEPKGVIFQAALQYSNEEVGAVYELPISALNIPLKNSIISNDTSSIPASFSSRINNISVGGSPVYVLRLGTAEYFIFRFIQVLLSFRRHGMGISRRPIKMTQRSHSFENLLVRITGGERSFRFHNDLSARLYRQLVASYLRYFLPTVENDMKRDTIFSLKYLRSASGTWMGYQISHFFFACLTELWLHEYEYRIDASSRVDSEPPFVLPSVDQFEVLRTVTRHLIVATAHPIKPSIPSQLLRFYDQLVDAAFVPFRVHLYRLIRLSLVKCPSDNTVTVVGGLWLDYIAPWRYFPSLGDVDSTNFFSMDIWKDYVFSNYFFYHTLLGSFMEYSDGIIESIGQALRNSPDESDKLIDEEGLKSTLLPPLLLLAKALAAISSFAEDISSVENAELISIFRSSSIINLSSSSISFIRRPKPVASSYNIKEQLSSLESERFTLLPLFKEHNRQSALRMVYWLECIYSSMMKTSEVNVNDEAAIEVSSRRFFTKTPAKRDHYEDQNDLKMVIIQCEEEMTALFNISESDYHEFSEIFEKTISEKSQSRSSNHFSILRQRTRLVPVIRPSERISTRLSTKGNPDDSLIKSYEVRLLVIVTAWISVILNKTFSRLMDWVEERSGCRVPGLVRNIHFNLRLFASVPNIVFISLTSLFLYLFCITFLF